MLCKHCQNETDERASGLCVHCGNPLGMGEYAPPDGFAFDPGSGKYYKTENRFNPHTGTSITKVQWFDANSGQYQATCSDEGALITPQQEVPTAPPALHEMPITAPPLPTEPLAVHEPPISAPPLPATEMPIAQKAPTPKNKHGKVAAIIVSLAVVVVVGGAGFGAWKLGMLDNILSKLGNEPQSISASTPEQSTTSREAAPPKPPESTDPSTTPEPALSVPAIPGDDGSDPDYSSTGTFRRKKDGVNLGTAGISIRYNGDKPEGYCTPDKVSELELFENGVSIGHFELNGNVSRFYNAESDMTLFDFSFTEPIQGDNRHFEVVYQYNGVQRGNEKLREQKANILAPYYGFVYEDTGMVMRLIINNSESFTIRAQLGGSDYESRGSYQIINDQFVELTAHADDTPLGLDSPVTFEIQADGSLQLIKRESLGLMVEGERFTAGVPKPGKEQGYEFGGMTFGFPFVGRYETSAEYNDPKGLLPVNLSLFDDWSFGLVNQKGGNEIRIFGFLEWNADEQVLFLVVNSYGENFLHNNEVVLRAQVSDDRQQMHLTTEKGSDIAGDWDITVYLR